MKSASMTMIQEHSYRSRLLSSVDFADKLKP